MALTNNQFMNNKQKIADAKYYQKNKEKIKKKVREYYFSNKEKIAERKHKWYLNKKNEMQKRKHKTKNRRLRKTIYANDRIR